MNIAIIIPCYNEAETIYQMVTEFKRLIPEANLYVYDNNSTDNTAEMALKAGAMVRYENRQGKGNVIRRMFADIEADIYVMVDGDATYDISNICQMIQILIAGPYDMVSAKRISQFEQAYRFGHIWGNRLFSGLVKHIFDSKLSDLLSGYRAFSKRFVKSFPCASSGFEIETELTIHALSLKMPVIEVSTNYYPRPAGSFSKLSTFKDGFYILRAIFNLIRSERPLLFFTILGILLLALSLAIGTPVILEYLKIHLVPRFPSAILAASLAILACLSFTCALILDSVAMSKREMKRLHYLSIPMGK